MPTASRSAGLRPISSLWRSIEIRWAAPGTADMEKTSPLPLATLVRPDLRTKPILTDFRIPPAPVSTAPAVPPRDPIVEWARRPLLESVHIVPSASDQYYTAGETRKQESLDKVFRAETPTRAVIATELAQWVVVDIELDSPQSQAPPLHLWAFLQPSNFDDKTRAFAGDDAGSRKDSPRAGWGEYLLEPAKGTAKRRTWQGEKNRGNTAGGPDKFTGTAISTNDWKVAQVDAKGLKFRYKLKVKVVDERTDGDIERSKKGHPALPQKDFEAGCWLKVWVRDPLAGWSRMPQDDENDQIVRSMGEQDPSGGSDGARDPSRLSQSSPSLRQPVLGAHAFRRDRLLLNAKSGRLEDSHPIYVLLLNPDTAKYLVELDRLLDKDDPNLPRKAGSIAACSIAAIVLAGILRRCLSQWNGKVGSRPAGSPHGAEWPEVAHRAQGEFLSKVVESLDLSNILAAYAMSGFQYASPMEALNCALQEHPVSFGSLAGIYDLIFDLSTSTGVGHYLDTFLDRNTKRDQARKQTRIPTTRPALRVTEQKEREKRWKETMRERLDLHKRLGLGLSDVRPKATFGPNDAEFSFPLAEAGSKTPLIKPAGVIVPLGPFPLSLQAYVLAGGGAKAFLKVHGNDDGSWQLGFGLEGSGELGVSLELSSPKLALPAKVAAKLDDEHKTKLKTESDKAASRIDHGIDLVEIVGKLQDTLNAGISLALDARLQAVLGFCVRWHPERGFEDFSLSLPGGMVASYQGPEGFDGSAWDTDAAQAFSVNVVASLTAGLHTPLLSMDYPLIQAPKLLHASPQDAALSLSGTILGKSRSLAEVVLAHWGKGRLDPKISQIGTGDIEFGVPLEFSVGCSEIGKDQIRFDIVRSEPEGCSAAPAVGVVPKDAVQWGKDKVSASLRLSCWRKDSTRGSVIVADWNPRRDATLHGKETPSSLFESLGGKLLQELTRTGSTQVRLRANHLGSLFSYSDPLTIVCPAVLKQECSVKDRILRISLSTLAFHDNALWMQIYRRSTGDFLALPSGNDWLFCSVEKDPTGDSTRTLVQLDWAPHLAVAPDDIYPLFSLVPHDEGIFNLAKAPFDLQRRFSFEQQAQTAPPSAKPLPTAVDHAQAVLHSLR